VKASRIQCDEIWSYCYAKERNVTSATDGAGDVWTWAPFDANAKLIVSYVVGNRSGEAAMKLMDDLGPRLELRHYSRTPARGLP
jgi:IS1 family transposase